MNPALFNAFLESPEADGGGEVEPGCGENAGHQPRALNVDVADQQRGDEPADDALNRQQMHPAPMPRQQAEDSGHENECEQCSGPAQPGRAAGPRVHPGPAQPAQPERQKERGNAQGLQKQVAHPGAKQAHPVVNHCVGQTCVGRGIQGRIGRVPGGDREQKQQCGEHQQQPEKHIQWAASRGRQDNGNGFHGLDAPALRNSDLCRQRANRAEVGFRSISYYRGVGGGFRAKTRWGNHGVDPLFAGSRRPTAATLKAFGLRPLRLRCSA